MLYLIRKRKQSPCHALASYGETMLGFRQTQVATKSWSGGIIIVGKANKAPKPPCSL